MVETEERDCITKTDISRENYGGILGTGMLVTPCPLGHAYMTSELRCRGREEKEERESPKAKKRKIAMS